jgi:hypothetical protein
MVSNAWIATKIFEDSTTGDDTVILGLGDSEKAAWRHVYDDVISNWSLLFDGEDEEPEIPDTEEDTIELALSATNLMPTWGRRYEVTFFPVYSYEELTAE